MSRSILATLAGASLLALSCAPTLPGMRELPAVSAAPNAPLPSPARDAGDSELVERVADHLRAQRRTTLTETEITAVAQALVGASRQHGVDPGLVLAVIHVESRFDAYAVSSVGAIGLMQILPSTGAELAARLGVAWRGPQTLFDPIANVKLGIAYLDELTDRYGDTAMALAAYNWGPGHIDERLKLGTPMPSVYPGLVLKAYSRQDEHRS